MQKHRAVTQCNLLCFFSPSFCLHVARKNKIPPLKIQHGAVSKVLTLQPPEKKKFRCRVRTSSFRFACHIFNVLFSPLKVQQTLVLLFSRARKVAVTSSQTTFILITVGLWKGTENDNTMNTSPPPDYFHWETCPLDVCKCAAALWKLEQSLRWRHGLGRFGELRACLSDELESLWSGGFGNEQSAGWDASFVVLVCLRDTRASERWANTSEN